MTSLIKYFVAILIVFLHKITLNAIDVGPTVEIKSGTIKGSILISRLGEIFYSFRGIRYGKAPVGDLRFQPPQPVGASPGTFDASEDGPICPQPIGNLSLISEDCLRLNVYTRNLHGKKPVLVYIPGGGFYVGGGATFKYGGPQYLMDRDIVLVTINYRIGVLGFLSLNIPEAPGNAGFKDQVLALHWIKNNIEYFGGDAESVTLIGNSAGGLSITLHMISPMSQGLFHRGILLSSGLRNLEPIKKHHIENAARHAKLLNCKYIESAENIYHCLKNRSATELALSARSLFEFAGDQPRLLWEPVIETDFGQSRFLTQQPETLFMAGQFHKVPLIIGVTQDELAPSAVKILLSPNTTKELDEHFKKIAPICFAYERDTEWSTHISNELWNFYNLSHPLTFDQADKLGNLFSDSIINFNTDRTIKMLHPQIDLFYYKFSYPGRYSTFYYPEQKPFGVEHTSDLLYLFVTHFAPPYTVHDRESITIERMIRLCTQFAATGNPNNASDEYIKDIDWKPYTSTHHHYLEIGINLTLKQNLNEDRFIIWYKLFHPEFVNKNQTNQIGN